MKTKMLSVFVLSIMISIMLTNVSFVYARGGCGSGGCGYGGDYSVVSLSDFEKEALNQAILEEYMAKAIYEKVVTTFGSISPFTWIIRDEQCHINRVANLLTKYGLPIPKDTWSGNINSEFESKQQACEVGAQAEFNNAAFYDTMISQISHDDIISSFGMLRDVSRYKHLLAFEDWAIIYATGGE